MKSPSRSSLFRAAATMASSASAIAATRMITDKWGPALFAGTAVLASQASNYAGDLNLGRAVSRSKLATEKVVRELGGSTVNLGTIESQIRSLSASVKQMQALPREAVKSVIKKAEGAPNPAADPKARRTGAPANNGPYKTVEARRNQPIVGEAARKWIDSRTGGDDYLPQDEGLSFRAAGVPFATEIPVAMIADDFTFHSFQHEFQTFRLTPSNWRTIFEKHKPRLFFCESAWQGGSPKEHPWQGKIYASIRWPKENRGVLLEILDYCHAHKIPTVFWNKEDPTHFADRINDFARTAGLFDYVFTTAEECVPGYKKDVGANFVGVLPFAVQPKLFNPIGSSSEGGVNFAGTWYGMYPERCAAQAQIMDQALDAGYELVIYDRMKDSPNPIYRYPERFEKFTHEAIPYEKTAEAYKQSRFGITMNTVTESKTMFARRVFELAASGSVVLSNEARGVREFFGDAVIYADTEPDRLKNLTESEYRDLQRKALNIALRNTYSHRAEQILETVGLNFQKYSQTPTVVVRISTSDEWDQLLEEFEKRESLGKLLVIVSTDCEQSLEFKLLQQHIPGVNVLNERSILNHEFRTRSFIGTPEFILFDFSKSFPSDDEIEELQLHNSYFDGQIGFAEAGAELYSVSESKLVPNTILPTSLLVKALSGEELPTYFV